MRLVLDTCVLVAAIRSRHGASHALMRRVGTGAFTSVVTVPLVLEYEAALRRNADDAGLDEEDVAVLIDYVCAASEHATVFFLWRPLLSDPGDDHVLEAAVASGCDAIVTFNLRHFVPARRFGIDVLTPAQALDRTGGPS
jgi:predicted nucleic acid-binding protein